MANRRVIDRVIVGNETQLFGSVSAEQLGVYLDRVRAALPARIKVTTAEPWSTWVVIPEVAKHVDVVFVHLLPYWENVHISSAMRFIGNHYDITQQTFPDKPIIVGEAGWPSEGRTRGSAQASMANEAYFVRTFVQFAQGATGIVQIDLASGSQLHRSPGSIQQLHVEQIFQVLDLLRQRGL